MTSALLTINAGSSSIKFAVFSVGSALKVRVSGQVERIGTAPRFIAHDAASGAVSSRSWPHGAARSYEDIFDDLLKWVEAHLAGAELVGVGHRVVHGGQHLAAPVVVTPSVIDDIEALIPLAPLHQPHSLHAIRTLAKLRPDLPQVACFDTAFHRGHADAVRHYALPRDLSDSGIERYGFHGLSYEFIAGRLRDIEPGLAAGSVVVAHLGNGASLCALRDGKSVDTTMGFTAVDGLPMGTRCGAIDPGVILYLQQARGMSAGDIETLIYSRSGLLGVSGVSSDMRKLLASSEPHAAEAVEMFCYRIACATAAMATAAGGLDALVFTAGIGEKAAQVRARVCALLAWLGVALDDAANLGNARRISSPQSKVAVLVVPTDEESMIARHAWELVKEAVLF
jgi:acetate kinase